MARELPIAYRDDDGSDCGQNHVALVGCTVNTDCFGVCADQA